MAAAIVVVSRPTSEQAFFCGEQACFCGEQVCFFVVSRPVFVVSGLAPRWAAQRPQ
jgi:hypothetical protein